MKLLFGFPSGLIEHGVEMGVNESTGVKEKQYYIQGIFSTIGVKNQNSRVYPLEIWERVVSEYQKEIQNKTKNTLSEWEHPIDRSEVDPMNAVGVIKEIGIKSNQYVEGKIKLLSNEKSTQLKRILDEGIEIGVSSRGLGDVSESGVVTDFELITFDLVSSPSDYNGYLRLAESAEKKCFESKRLLITKPEIVTPVVETKEDDDTQKIIDFIKKLKV